MILIGRKNIIAFGRRHPQSRRALSAWEGAIKKTDYYGFNGLKLSFPSIDFVYHRYTIFDISGNKYRLVTEINYPAKVVNIKRIWTHAEYSMKKSEDAMRNHQL